MKRLILKSTCQKDVDDIVAKYDQVVGRDAKKWANKLIKEHSLNIYEEEPEDYESVVEAEEKKKKYGYHAKKAAEPVEISKEV